MFVGPLYWLLGRPDMAIEMMEQCIRLGAKAGFLPSQLYIASILASSFASLGDFDRALPLAQQTLALATESMPYYQPSSLAFLGSVQLLYGNNQEADDVYNEILAINRTQTDRAAPPREPGRIARPTWAGRGPARTE